MALEQSKRQLFFYGTLRDPAVLATVLGRAASDIVMRPAVLPGYAVYAVKGREFPFAEAQAEGRAEGVLVSGLGQTDIARLEFYEGAYLYQLIPVSVELGDKTETGELFVTDYDGWQADGPWSLSGWMAADEGVSAQAAIEVMSYFGQRSALKVFKQYPSIRARARAKMKAQADDVNG